uniref:ZU5 domain-containing protein n=1 Tax=Macrostomum lignano TaxID=282301 RepID=A0A1I8FHY2_9PLAT
QPVRGRALRLRATPTKCASLCRPQATVVADTEASIMVDASGGRRRITTSNDSELDIDLEENADGTVSLYYTPRIPGMQAIEIRFGGQLIPDGELQQMVIEEDEIVEKQLARRAIRKSTLASHLTLDQRQGWRHRRFDQDSERRGSPTRNADGRCSFVYRPSEVGQHELQVLMDGEPVAGSPFKFYVDCLGLGHVTAYGPGLCYGRSGSRQISRVVTKEAGPGNGKFHFKCVCHSVAE